MRTNVFTLAKLTDLIANCRDEKDAVIRANLLNEILSVVHDVDEQIIEAERAQEDAVADFKNVFDFSPIPKFFFGAEGILDCNFAAMELLRSRSKSEILYKHPSILSPEFQPDGRRSDEKSLEMDRLANEKGFHRFEWTHLALDGIEILVEVTLAPINLNKQKVLLCVWRDLTETRRLEADVLLERTKAIHSAKLASLGEMSANIAHEINNPLGIIAGNIKLLKKFKDNPEKFEEKLVSAEKACHRIEKIVKGLQKFTRSTDTLEHKPESLASIIQEAITVTEAKSKLHATPVSMNIASNEIIYCDAVEIEQVLINLINNAVDAVKLRADRWIEIKLFQLGSEIVLQVIDSGSGLSAEIEKSLFQPFFTTKDVGEGTGLGLSISRSILRSHSATLNLNRAIQNTCFEIRFPREEGLKNVA